MKNFEPLTAHIVYASDDRFAEILGVSLVSLYENSKDMDTLIVYILDSGISDENKQKLLSVCQSYKQPDVIFIPAENISKKLSINVAVDRGSLSQYARLFISSNLPENLGRVLYLDCDTIIKESIKELWNLDLHGHTIAALMDAFSKHYRANIGLGKNDLMFNSGVMLIDLDKWRKQKVEEKLMKFIAAKNGRIQQGDQGALNHVLSQDTYCFEPRFNSVTIFHDFAYKDMLIYRKPPVYYSEQEIRKAVEEPVIVHYTTSFLSKRPWMKGCVHRYAREWMRYRNMSPWDDIELREDKRSMWTNGSIIIFKMLPNCIAIRLAGIMQAYARPFKNKWLH